MLPHEIGRASVKGVQTNRDSYSGPDLSICLCFKKAKPSCDTASLKAMVTFKAIP